MSGKCGFDASEPIGFGVRIRQTELEIRDATDSMRPEPGENVRLFDGSGCEVVQRTHLIDHARLSRNRRAFSVEGFDRDPGDGRAANRLPWNGSSLEGFGQDSGDCRAANRQIRYDVSVEEFDGRRAAGDDAWTGLRRPPMGVPFSYTARLVQESWGERRLAVVRSTFAGAGGNLRNRTRQEEKVPDRMIRMSDRTKERSDWSMGDEIEHFGLIAPLATAGCARVLVMTQPEELSQPVHHQNRQMS
jgi:hypothetical protein